MVLSEYINFNSNDTTRKKFWLHCAVIKSFVNAIIKRIDFAGWVSVTRYISWSPRSQVSVSVRRGRGRGRYCCGRGCECSLVNWEGVACIFTYLCQIFRTTNGAKLEPRLVAKSIWWWSFTKTTKYIQSQPSMVFCYQNCSGLVSEKIVLFIWTVRFRTMFGNRMLF